MQLVRAQVVAPRITDEIREPTQRLAAFLGPQVALQERFERLRWDCTACVSSGCGKSLNSSHRPIQRIALRCGSVSVSHSGPLARPSISSNCRANAVADTAHMRSAPPGGRGAIPMRVNNPCPGPFHARRAARARPAGPAAPDPVAGAARRIPPDAPRGVHQAGTRQWHRKTSFPKLGLGVDEVGSCC